MALQGGPLSATSPLKNMESSSLTANWHCESPRAPRKPILWKVRTGDGWMRIIVRQCLEDKEGIVNLEEAKYVYSSEKEKYIIIY